MARVLPRALAGWGRAPVSVVTRLTLLNLAVLASTLLVSFVLLATLTAASALMRQADAAEAGARVLAGSVAPMLAFSDRSAAAAELASYARRADVLEVRLIDARGATFAEWRAPRAQPLPPWPVVAAFREIVGDEVRIGLPVEVMGETAGRLEVRESLEAVERGLLRVARWAVATIVVALLAAAVLLRRVQRAALAPIVELARVADDIARDRDYSRRVRVGRLDEVGRLAERFNDLLHCTERWDADLRRRLDDERESGQQFQRLAHQDGLTGLPNRLLFEQTLRRLAAAAADTRRPLALMFIDLDDFKRVNDSQGHEVGDAVLREAARRMSGVLRNEDCLCRIGGDEFALLLPGLEHEAAAERTAERLIAAVRAPMDFGAGAVVIGATVGLAFCPADAAEPEALLRAADAAMYAAKRSGKNSWRRAGASSPAGAGATP